MPRRRSWPRRSWRPTSQRSTPDPAEVGDVPLGGTFSGLAPARRRSAESSTAIVPPRGMNRRLAGCRAVPTLESSRSEGWSTWRPAFPGGITTRSFHAAQRPRQPSRSPAWRAVLRSGRNSALQRAVRVRAGAGGTMASESRRRTRQQRRPAGGVSSDALSDRRGAPRSGPARRRHRASRC
jgi:hypothetical protein